MNFATACIFGDLTHWIDVHGDPRTHQLLAGFVKNDFTQQLTHLLSLSIMATLAVSWLNWTAESLVKSIKPNCSCCSSITRSSWMGMVLQSSMGEFVNVRDLSFQSEGNRDEVRWTCYGLINCILCAPYWAQRTRWSCLIEMPTRNWHIYFANAELALTLTHSYTYI